MFHRSYKLLSSCFFLFFFLNLTAFSKLNIPPQCLFKLPVFVCCITDRTLDQQMTLAAVQHHSSF